MTTIFLAASNARNLNQSKKKKELHTESFLDICHHAVAVVDKFGVGMAVVKNDINGNISKVQKSQEKVSNDVRSDLYKLVLDRQENLRAKKKNKKQMSEAAIALLWLYRAMAFMVSILTNIAEADPTEQSLKDPVIQAYLDTVEPYHGWFLQNISEIAMNFIPTRQHFLHTLLNGTENEEHNVLCEMRTFVDELQPILSEVFEFLCNHDLNDQTKVG